MSSRTSVSSGVVRFVINVEEMPKQMPQANRSRTTTTA
jgi:hypothetical protein